MTIRLEATTAMDARMEIKRRFPEGATYRGYDEDGVCVLMGLVRERGNRAPVATASRNRGKKAIKFTAEPREMKIVSEMKDMRDVGSVEVQIKENGGVIWVNVDGVCQLRITKLKNLRIIDERTKEVRKLIEIRRVK